jgi:NADH dehydrogenase FAD-containing subunit
MGAIENARVGSKAKSLLRGKDVEVLKSTMVEKVAQGSTTKKWAVELMPTGRRIEADTYVDTTGAIPKNEFIPKSYLNDGGWVNVDTHLRVVDSETSRPDTFAVGDIPCHPYRLMSRIPVQAEAVEKRLATYSSEEQRRMLVVPVGQSTGTGHVGGWPLLGCLVWYFKAQDFLVYKAPKFLKGDAH